MLDIFKNDAFSTTSLSSAMVDLKFKPGRLGELGLFSTKSIDTTTFAIEKKGEMLILVASTPRGGPGVTIDKDKRELRYFGVPHFEINDAVYAEEVQNIRAFGTEKQLETVANKLSQRLQLHVNSFGVTEEYLRMGAISGLITYPAGSSDANLDLYTEFGVTAEAEIDFDLDNAAPAEGVLRKKCAGIIRQMAGILDGLPFDGIHVLCGDNFFDDLLAHKEVRDTYKGWNEAQILREAYIGPNRSSYGIFEFGGIVWENYRGAVGGTGFINTDKCQILPLGVPGLFESVFAPADYIETVNTMGQRLYALQYEMQNQKGIHLDAQMNALHYCKRPKALIKGKRT